MNNRIKTRDLSPIEYLEILIVEYFQSITKSKIHHSPKNKRYYESVTQHKENTIKDLCDKKGLPCLFDNPDDLKKNKKLFFEKFGIEHFNFNQNEKILYFSPKNDFLCKKINGVKIVKSKSFNERRNVLSVIDQQGKIFDVAATDVRRIL
jgi:hypothetical protein